MPMDTLEWLPLNAAAAWFGYSYPGSLRRRLRQLRKRGYVIDIGNPPAGYKRNEESESGKVVLMWPNPKTALIRSDAPAELLNSKRGKRASS